MSEECHFQMACNDKKDIASSLQASFVAICLISVNESFTDSTTLPKSINSEYWETLPKTEVEEAGSV